MSAHRRPSRTATVSAGIASVGGVASVAGCIFAPDPTWRAGLFLTAAALFYVAKWLLDQDAADERSEILGNRIVEAIQTVGASVQARDQARTLAMGQELQGLISIGEEGLTHLRGQGSAAAPDPAPVTAPVAHVPPVVPPPVPAPAGDQRRPRHEQTTGDRSSVLARLVPRDRGDTGDLFRPALPEPVADALSPEWPLPTDTGRAS